MKIKKIIILIIVFFLLAILFIGIFTIIKPFITGFATKATENSFENFYTHTKAICNESNFCQDYEITCKNKEVILQKPITGAVIQHLEDWKDLRKDAKSLCE